MAVYALWNNKGGVGKSYLTFQIASEYARTHLEKKILVIDLCPQANASSMLLGGMLTGEVNLDSLCSQTPRKTIAGYIEDRIRSPYINPKTGAAYMVKISQYNPNITENLYLITGDEQLEIQTSRVSSATYPGPEDAWRSVHTWVSDLINDVNFEWNQNDMTIFIDCNPSFSIYTELAMSAADRLIIPFSADGSSKRAVRTVLSLLYGISRHQGTRHSDFYLNTQRYRLLAPKIYCYVGNRLTQYVKSAVAFNKVVSEIGEEIWSVWQNDPNLFHVRGLHSLVRRKAFDEMFQVEIGDANSASVVSSTLGIPIMNLTAGQKSVLGKRVTVNQSQLDKQQPNISKLVASIE